MQECSIPGPTLSGKMHITGRLLASMQFDMVSIFYSIIYIHKEYIQKLIVTVRTCMLSMQSILTGKQHFCFGFILSVVGGGCTVRRLGVVGYWKDPPPPPPSKQNIMILSAMSLFIYECILENTAL
jgi:hypothetical protein